MITRKAVTISLPEKFVERSKQFAKQKGYSFSGLVHFSLEKIMREENERVRAK